MKYKLNPQLAYRKIENEIYIVDVKNSLLYKLNPTATVVWECIKKGKDLNKIVRYVTEEYEVDIETAISDIKQLLADMEQKGLIVKE